MEFQVEVEFKGQILKGILINETDKYLVVKLSSGYNANLEKNNSKILKKEKLAESEKKISEKKENTNLPKISILHTGGTIASKIDYRTGAVSSKFTPAELLNLFPELNEKANISTKLIANLFSEDMRFDEYNLILTAIEEEIKNGTNGIIISHGTDTMHYSAASLHYAIKNLSVPIILVGAQRSSDRPSSDAFTNLSAAVDFILSQLTEEVKFRRVGICMHENISDTDFLILDCINAKKLHSTRRDAFKQVNYLPYAKISYHLEHGFRLEVLRSELQTTKPKDKSSYVKYDSKLKLGFFKSHPNTFAGEIELLKYYDAVIVEGTGIGNVAESENNSKQDGLILAKFKEISKDVKLIPAVQTVYGEVSLDIYSRGRDMQNCGFIGNRFNLISETLFARSAHILSLSDGKKNFEKYWKENLEGFEIRNEDL